MGKEEEEEETNRSENIEECHQENSKAANELRRARGGRVVLHVYLRSCWTGVRNWMRVMIEVRECEEEEVQEWRRCGDGDRCSNVLLNWLRVQVYVSRAGGE